MVFRNFLGNNSFFGRTPTGRKWWLSGILARFGPERFEESRARAENTKMQFPGARGTFGGEVWPPQKFLPEFAEPFSAFCFG